MSKKRLNLLKRTSQSQLLHTLLEFQHHLEKEWGMQVPLLVARKGLRKENMKRSEKLE